MYNCTYEVDNNVGSAQCVVFCGHRTLLRVKEESEQLHSFFLTFFPSSDQMLFTLFVLAVMMFSFSSFLFITPYHHHVRGRLQNFWVYKSRHRRSKDTLLPAAKAAAQELKTIMTISRSVSFNLINTHHLIVNKLI